MTREEAYRQANAKAYTAEQIEDRIRIIKQYAEERGVEPFSGPEWLGLDDYIRRKQSIYISQ
jgi:hypothetical protein